MGSTTNPGCGCTSGGSGGGGIGDIPFCFCQETPGTLAMVSSDQTLFQNCTLTYQLIPASILTIVGTGLGTSGYFSPLLTQVLVIGNFGGGFTTVYVPFYYYLTCQYNIWTLTAIYPPSPEYPYGGQTGVLYTWGVGGPGGVGPNTCAVNSLHLNVPTPPLTTLAVITING